MNPAWLARNIASSWSSCASWADFVRRMRLLYSARLPPAARALERLIAFRYPPPIGQVRFLLRDNAGADLFIHSEVFEREYYHLPLARRPATVLDLGSNIGLSAVYFGRHFPEAQLACVEPAPDNLRLLARNLDLNSVRATVFSAAVDASDGRVLLELQARDYEHRIVAQPVGTSRPTLEVDAVSVPTVLRRLSWDRIGLLKVDIEGHEAHLFARNCDWLGRVDDMCIECHDGFDGSLLASLGERFGFAPPQRLPGIWFMTRHETAATAS